MGSSSSEEQEEHEEQLQGEQEPDLTSQEAPLKASPTIGTPQESRVEELIPGEPDSDARSTQDVQNCLEDFLGNGLEQAEEGDVEEEAISTEAAKPAPSGAGLEQGELVPRPTSTPLPAAPMLASQSPLMSSPEGEYESVSPPRVAPMMTTMKWGDMEVSASFDGSSSRRRGYGYWPRLHGLLVRTRGSLSMMISMM